MTNLSPGSVQVAVRTARLLVTLDRESARTATVALGQSNGVTLRPGKPGLWVLEAEGAASATVRLLARADPSGSAMVGTSQLTIRSVPLAGGVADGLEWVVTELRPEGRRTLDVLAIDHDTAHNWTMRSLLANSRPLDPDAASQAARQYLGDQSPVSLRALVAVDRSASMAWAFRPGGELEAVLRGLWAALIHTVTADVPVSWLSFGSGVGLDGLAWVPSTATTPGAAGEQATEAAGRLLEQLRPQLFASGSDPAGVAAHASRTGIGTAFVVTDSLAAAARLRGAGGTHFAAIVVGVVPGMRLPADEAAHLQAAQAGNVSVLCVAPSAAGQGEPDPVPITRWAIDELLASTSLAGTSEPVMAPHRRDS